MNKKASYSFGPNYEYRQDVNNSIRFAKKLQRVIRKAKKKTGIKDLDIRITYIPEQEDLNG